MYMEFQFEDNFFGIFPKVGAEMLDAFVFWPINSVEDISTRAPLPSNPDSMVISYIQLYDCFLSFYYSSLTFKLSNKTALMKHSTRYLGRAG